MIIINKIVLKHMYKSIDTNPILNDVNLELQSGTIYGFIGQNGSGKTMLFRIMAGLVRPSEGSVKYYINNNERNINDVSKGVMIENAELYPELSAFENLDCLASMNKKISKKEIKEILCRLGFDSKNHKKYCKYSLGMRHRLVFAQAVMEKPDVILLDEPTNALDEESVHLIRDMIKDEKERGAIICVASHNKEDISILCDKIFSINNHNVTKMAEME